jgi:hypothetical protein
MYFNKFITSAFLATVLATLLTACGGGGSNAGGSTPTPTPAPVPANTLPVTVDLGPTDETGKLVGAANTLYTTVTVCQPGSSTNCQTIDHVLVDTGSTGLRLLSSQLKSSLNLPPASSGGLPVLNCVQFVDNTFMWGPVVTADVVLALVGCLPGRQRWHEQHCHSGCQGHSGCGAVPARLRQRLRCTR